MVGQYHRLNDHEFGQVIGVGDGWRHLACCSSWGHKVSDMTEQLNWTECQCRRHKRGRFDPYVCKIPWRREWQYIPEFLSWDFWPPTPFTLPKGNGFYYNRYLFLKRLVTIGWEILGPFLTCVVNFFLISWDTGGENLAQQSNLFPPWAHLHSSPHFLLSLSSGFHYMKLKIPS